MALRSARSPFFLKRKDHNLEEVAVGGFFVEKGLFAMSGKVFRLHAPC